MTYESLMKTKQPFQVGEKVRPHVNFRNYYYRGCPEHVTVKTCEKGFCQSGWLVTIHEFPTPPYGKQEFDSGWFFKINK